jgi:hypothetical protein
MDPGRDAFSFSLCAFLGLRKELSPWSFCVAAYNYSTSVLDRCAFCKCFEDPYALSCCSHARDNSSSLSGRFPFSTCWHCRSSSSEFEVGLLSARSLVVAVLVHTAHTLLGVFRMPLCVRALMAATMAGRLMRLKYSWVHVCCPFDIMALWTAGRRWL